MKKVRNILAAFVMMAVCVMSLTGCGVDMEKMKGDWTVDTIDGKSVADFCAENGVDEAIATQNYKITDDNVTVEAVSTDTLTVEKKDYKNEIHADGFMAKDGDKDVQSFKLENDEVSTMLNFGDGDKKVVLKKGTSDLQQLLDAAQAGAADAAAAGDAAAADAAAADAAAAGDAAAADAAAAGDAAADAAAQ